MSAQMYIARLIDEGRADRGPNGIHRHAHLHRTRPTFRSWRARRDHRA